jgi:hypothetical protein
MTVQSSHEYHLTIDITPAGRFAGKNRAKPRYIDEFVHIGRSILDLRINGIKIGVGGTPEMGYGA